MRLSKILYINNNDFHNLGRSQMCAGGCCYFRPSKPHSGTLWVLMAQTSWNFVCGFTWVVSERFHDQKGTIMCQAPGWVQDPKIQKFQEFWNSDIFFIFFVQNWLPRTQRPFPLNSWWKNGPFWCKNHCSSSKTVDFSIFSGGARKKVGPLGGPLSDMTPNTLVYHFSYIFRKSQWVWGVLAPK